MASRWMTLAVGVLCACLLALPGVAGAKNTSPPVPPGFVGVNVDGPLFPVSASGVDLSQQMDKMVAAGVETLRIGVDWSYAQPYRTWAEVPPDQASQFTSDQSGIPTRWGNLDQLVTLAAEHRLTVLPIVLYTPGWDSGPHPSDAFAIPKSTAPYANFMADLVRRYGPHGTLWQTVAPSQPIRSWQIWNEPNIHVFWYKQPFQKSYAALLHASHDAIKRLDPGAKIVLAGLPNQSWTQLAKFYKVPGVKRWFDVVALHPYTAQPQGVLTILQRARRVMIAAGDKRKPIIADEISWPSSLGKTPHSNGFDIGVTEAGQARKISQILPLLVQNRHSLNLQAFYWYTWAGLDQRNAGAFEFSGLLHFDESTETFTEKPAYSAFRTAALGMEHCRRKGSVATSCVARD